MANDNIPDYMRGFDLNEDFGITPISSKPETQQPTIDPSLIENNNIEISHIKSDVSTIKSMINEIMEIVNEKNSLSKEVTDDATIQRFKDIEKIILPFLYNLSKSNEPYIHWPNRGPIIKAQIEKILKLTRV